MPQGWVKNRLCFLAFWLTETNKQKITLLHTFWSQLEVEVSNICQRDYLSDISDVSEARILMKHPDARIPEQKVRSSNKQPFFPLQLWNQNYSVILWAFFFSLNKSNVIRIIIKSSYSWQLDIMGVTFVANC